MKNLSNKQAKSLALQDMKKDKSVKISVLSLGNKIKEFPREVVIPIHMLIAY